MDQHARFIRLFQYERDAGRRVIASLRSAQQRIESGGPAAMSPAFTRAVEIFAHIQAARQIWLSRIDADAAPPEAVFPAGWSLDRCERETQALDDAWEKLVETLPRTGLDTDVEYRSTEGKRYASTLADILSHVINHGTYHRGQIARLVAECGADPAVTDFIACSRRALD